jgi:uncharacterized membrane protein
MVSRCIEGGTMNFSIRFGLAALAVYLLAAVSVAPASAQTSAPLTLCNKTDVPLNTAIGYHTPGTNDGPDHNLLTGPFVTKGWEAIAPGACHTFENPFNARYMFWFGTSTKFNSDEMQAGNIVKPSMDPNLYCIPRFDHGAPPFVFEDENARVPPDQTDPCEASGKNMWADFRSVDTWVSSTINFTGQ